MMMASPEGMEQEPLHQLIATIQGLAPAAGAPHTRNPPQRPAPTCAPLLSLPTRDHREDSVEKEEKGLEMKENKEMGGGVEKEEEKQKRVPRSRGLSFWEEQVGVCCRVWQGVAVCCRVLPGGAGCCSALQSDSRVFFERSSLVSFELT